MDRIDDVIGTTRQLRAPKSARQQIAPQLWHAAVGSRIANRATPIRVDRGVLIIRAATAAWANELTMLSEQILGALRSNDIAVEALRFEVGAVSPTETKQRPPRRAPRRDAPLPEALGRQLQGLDNESLGEAIGQAAALSLAAQALRPEESPED